MSLDLEALESRPPMELLLQAEQPLPAALVRATGIEKKLKTEKKKASAPVGIHNQINRLLGRISKPAGVAVPLTSHSFCRGGWSLSSQQKIWSYVFNTTQEAQRVAKVLGGWASTSRVPLDCIDVHDDDVKSRVRCFTSLLFNTCMGLQNPRLNVCGIVPDALAGRLLRALPLVRDLQPSAPIVARVDACAAQAGLRRDQFLAVSMYLQQTYNDKLQRTEIKPTNDTTVWGQQTALIRELLDANRLLVNRLEALEAKVKPAGAESAEPIKKNEQVSDLPKAPRKNSPATHLSAVWFEWYAGEPRLWSKDAKRKKRSEARHVVAFMKLFLDRGFSLDPVSESAIAAQLIYICTKHIKYIDAVSNLRDGNTRSIPEFWWNFPQTTIMAARFSAREFKGVAIQAVAAASAAIRKIRVDNEVIRKLRLQMVKAAETREALLEVLTVIMMQVAERATSRKVRFEDVKDIIEGLPDTTCASDMESDEAEWTSDSNLAAEPTWQMERVLDRFRGPDRRWYFLVAWAPTVGPVENIPRGMVAAFDRERRAIVRRAYIEDEAEEA